MLNQAAHLHTCARGNPQGGRACVPLCVLKLLLQCALFCLVNLYMLLQ